MARPCAALLACCALLCAAARAAEPHAKPVSPLDDEPSLARTGCVAVLDTLGIMLRNPPAEMARRMVTVQGQEHPQPYTSTDAFLDDTFRALCGSAALGQYRIATGWLGEPLWQEDPVSYYTPEAPPVPPRLGKLCRLMVKRHRRKMLAAMAPGTASLWEACGLVLGVRAPTDARGRVLEALATLRAHPAALLRLSPFFIAAVGLPFMLRPLVSGQPPLPEPRGPPEPGDADAAEGDEGDVGCMPAVVALTPKTKARKRGKKGG